MTIKNITMEHLARYGEIYAEAFSGEPWNDPWKPVGVHLITAADGILPDFYRGYGFEREKHVILMGREL